MNGSVLAAAGDKDLEEVCNFDDFDLLDSLSVSARAIPKQGLVLPYSLGLVSRGLRPLWFEGMYRLEFKVQGLVWRLAVL